MLITTHHLLMTLCAPKDGRYLIVAKVERRLSLDHEVESQVEVNLLRAERLRQSLLAQVFSGKAAYLNTGAFGGAHG